MSRNHAPRSGGRNLALNAETVDIETVGHEMRHAVMWALSGPTYEFSVNLLSREAEEHFSDLLDDMTRHVVRFIEQRFGHELPYIHGHVHDPDYEIEIPDEIKRLIDGD